MENTTKHLTRDPAFDRFLGAMVGEDRSGTDVTVLSMLARLGVDPWDEASTLAGMGDAPARKRLQALLSRFRDVPSLLPDSHETVARLLAFLPRARASARPSASGTPAGTVVPTFPTPLHWIIATLVLLGVLAYLTQGQ